MRKLAIASILSAIGIIGILSLKGDNIRSTMGASADALAGDEYRSVNAREDGTVLEGHKNLADFSATGGGAGGGYAAGPARPRAGERAYDWRPSSGETRSRTEIARRPWAGTLTAKVWCDAEAFGQWIDFVGERQNAPGPFARIARSWSLSTTDRIAVTVRGSEGRAVVDAPVVLQSARGETLFRARTDNRGRAYLFPSLDGRRRSNTRMQVVAHHGGSSHRRGARGGDELELVLPDRTPSPRSVGDVMLMMDTTGSMGDELAYLQSELENVISRADHQLVQQVKLRLSVNFYRDRDDAYVVRSFPFTDRLEKATGALLEQQAGGGGDYPEAVELALEDALQDHRWSESARGRILFLVLDAPPHRSAVEIDSLHRSLTTAARKGIRIFPVAGSGVDKDTEFLLRHFAVVTGGSYVYLTDDSGVGGGHVEATGGKSQTERLNDLMTRLIVESFRNSDESGRVYQARR